MPLTAQQIDELRMPNAYQAPTGVSNPYAMMIGGAGGLGMYSRPNSGQPQGYNPDPRGMVDPEALKALAYGTEYDIEARRNAIAARIAENELAAAAAAAPAQSARAPRGPADAEIGSGMSAGVIPGMTNVSNYLAPGGAWMDPNVPQPGADGGSFF